MKKLIIGALVGGILVFAWQSLSWTMLHLHNDEVRMAPNQDQILSSLSSQLTEDGQYFIPTIDPKASKEEREKFMTDMEGKPWALVSYHKAFESDMVMNMVRGVLAAIVAAFLVCWVIMKNTNRTFGTTLASTLFIGIAGFLFIPYSGSIWMEVPGAVTNFIDVLVSWGLCGIWLGWWLNRP